MNTRIFSHHISILNPRNSILMLIGIAVFCPMVSASEAESSLNFAAGFELLMETHKGEANGVHEAVAQELPDIEEHTKSDDETYLLSSGSENKYYVNLKTNSMDELRKIIIKLNTHASQGHSAALSILWDLAQSFAKTPNKELAPHQAELRSFALSSFSTAAASNNPKALMILGILALRNSCLGVKDLPLARKYLELAAQTGFAPAQNALAIFYLGFNTPQTKKVSLKLFKKAAAQGNPDAHRNIAILDTLDGHDDTDEEISPRTLLFVARALGDQVSKDLMRKIAKIDGDWGCEEMRRLLRNHFGTSTLMPHTNLAKPEQSATSPFHATNLFIDRLLGLLREHANKDDEFSQINLAIIFFNGALVPANLDLSKGYLDRAIHLGSAEANKLMAFFCDNSEKIGRDSTYSDDYRNNSRLAEEKQNALILKEEVKSQSRPMQPFQQLVKRALDGCGSAQAMLGDLYFRGKVVPFSAEHALKWYKRSSANGNSKGQLGLALLHLDHRCRHQNYAKAKELLEQADSQADSEATFLLGYLYEKGLGVDQSYRVCNEYYQQAVSLGSIRAMVRLAKIKKQGLEGKTDYREALSLLVKALNKGYRDAMPLILEIAKLEIAKMESAKSQDAFAASETERDFSSSIGSSTGSATRSSTDI